MEDIIQHAFEHFFKALEQGGIVTDIVHNWRNKANHQFIVERWFCLPFDGLPPNTMFFNTACVLETPRNTDI